MKYLVTIERTRTVTLTVEAESEKEAYDAASESENAGDLDDIDADYSVSFEVNPSHALTTDYTVSDGRLEPR